MEPCIHINRIPCHLKFKFLEGVLSSQEWAHLIIDAVAHISVSDRINNKDDSDNKMEGNKGEEDGDNEFVSELSWEDEEAAAMEAKTDWGPTA
jgi:hypothetical protein